jgi:hypothetical protein
MCYITDRVLEFIQVNENKEIDSVDIGCYNNMTGNEIVQVHSTIKELYSGFNIELNINQKIKSNY